MPYKDPEKAKEYRRQYYRKYQPEWRAKNPNYAKDYMIQWRKDNPDKVKTMEANRPGGWRPRYEAYMAKNSHKIKARAALRYAVKKGKILKPDECESCRGTDRIEADHHDYSKPLEVIWLCRLCHLELTVKRLRETGKHLG